MGYVETNEDTWVFAMNLDLKDEADLPLRAALTRDASRATSIID